MYVSKYGTQNLKYTTMNLFPLPKTISINEEKPLKFKPQHFWSKTKRIKEISFGHTLVTIPLPQTSSCVTDTSYYSMDWARNQPIYQTGLLIEPIQHTS